MPDEPEPPRKFYELKPRDFDRVNKPRPGQEPGFHPAESQMPEDAPDRIDIRDLHRQGAMPVSIGQRPPDAALNDVQELMRANHGREDAAGLNRVPYKPKRKSRRKRDYVLCMAVSTAFFGTLAVMGWRTGNAILFVSSIAGLGMLAASLTWVMLFIMDDY